MCFLTVDTRQNVQTSLNDWHTLTNVVMLVNCSWATKPLISIQGKKEFTSRAPKDNDSGAPCIQRSRLAAAVWYLGQNQLGRLMSRECYSHLTGWWGQIQASYQSGIRLISFPVLNAVSIHRKTLTTIKILHWQSIFTLSFPLFNMKLHWHTAPLGTPFISLSMLLLVPWQKLLHASDSTVPYEVHFGDTGQLLNTQNISTDACFHRCFFPKHPYSRMEVALLVVFPSEAGIPFTSNLSCDTIGSSNALYFE